MFLAHLLSFRECVEPPHVAAVGVVVAGGASQGLVAAAQALAQQPLDHDAVTHILQTLYRVTSLEELGLYIDALTRLPFAAHDGAMRARLAAVAYAMGRPRLPSPYGGTSAHTMEDAAGVEHGSMATLAYVALPAAV